MTGWADALDWFARTAGALLALAGRDILLSAVLFVVVLVLAGVLRGAAPALRHALWTLVLLRLLLPPGLGHPFSLGSLVADRLDDVAGEAVWTDVWSMTGQAGPPLTPRPVGRGMASGPSRPTPVWPALLLVAWCAGGLAVGRRIARRRGALRAVLRRARPVTEARAVSLVERWRRELGVRRPVQVLTGEDPVGPFTVGVVRPRIFVPAAVLRSPDPTLPEAVVAHEIAHVRRWDDLLLRGQLAVAVLYFFNPIAWLSVRRAQTEAELACDELVLSRRRLAPREYGRGLLAVARLGLSGVSLSAPAMNWRRRRLEMRIERIVKLASRPARRLPSGHSLPATVALGVFLLPMAGPSGPGVALDPAPTAPTAREAPVDAMAQRQAPDAGQSIVLSNPMPGARVTSAWGPAVNPFDGKEAHHRGVDVAGPSGSEVHAAADGVVREATTDYSGGAAHGTVVVIDHGRGVTTFYSHLADLLVTPGQSVGGGEVIGTQGSTGRVTGPHLHFEVWVNGEPRDPADFVAEWR